MNKHSLLIHGHRTSVTLEPEFWTALTEIAKAQNKSIAAIIAEIDDIRQTNLSSALRVYILQSYRK